MVNLHAFVNLAQVVHPFLETFPQLLVNLLQDVVSCVDLDLHVVDAHVQVAFLRIDAVILIKLFLLLAVAHVLVTGLLGDARLDADQRGQFDFCAYGGNRWEVVHVGDPVLELVNEVEVGVGQVLRQVVVVVLEGLRHLFYRLGEVFRIGAPVKPDPFFVSFADSTELLPSGLCSQNEDGFRIGERLQSVDELLRSHAVDKHRSTGKGHVSFGGFVVLKHLVVSEVVRRMEHKEFVDELTIK